jgi:hypothetical protein
VAVIAFITDLAVVRRILRHLCLPDELVSPAPARRSPLEDDLCFDPDDGGAENEPPQESLAIDDDDGPRSRAPP